MKASTIQSLMARNREQIHSWEIHLSITKCYAEDYFKKDLAELAYTQVALIRKAKNQIAKLVAIQKALKSDLKDIYLEEQAAREGYVQAWVPQHLVEWAGDE